MPLNFQHAIGTMIDAGASDNDIAIWKASIQDKMGALIDKGADDASIEAALSGEALVDLQGNRIPLFLAPSDQKRQAMAVQAAANAALKNEPLRNRSWGETASDLVGKAARTAIQVPVMFAKGVVTGAPKLAAGAYRMVRDLGDPNPVPADQPIPSSAAQVVDSFRDIGRKVQSWIPPVPDKAKQASKDAGLYPPDFNLEIAPVSKDAPPSPGRDAREMLTDVAGMTLPFKATHMGVKSLLNPLGKSQEVFGSVIRAGGSLADATAAAQRTAAWRNTAARILTPPVFNVGMSLPEGDILKSAEAAGEGFSVSGVGELGGRVVIPAVKSGYNYVKPGGTWAERSWARKMGGAEGIARGYIDQLGEAVQPSGLIGVPGQGGATRRVTIEGSSKVAENRIQLAYEMAQARSSANYDKSDRLGSQLGPAKWSSAASSFTDLFNQIDPNSPGASYAVAKKISRLVNGLGGGPSGAERSIGAGGSRGRRAMSVDDFNFKNIDPRQAQAMADLKAAMNPLSGESGPPTFNKLTRVYRSLNDIHAPELKSQRLVALAKQFIERDLNKFSTPSANASDVLGHQALQAWREANKFHTEVKAKFGPGSPADMLIGGKDFGRFPVGSGSEARARRLAQLEPEEIHNFYNAIGEGKTGIEAVDYIQKGQLQLWKESVLDNAGRIDPKKVVASVFAKPGDNFKTRQLEALLGPETFRGVKALADGYRAEGFTGSPRGMRGAMGQYEAYHVAAGGIKSLAGHPAAAVWHFATAALMNLSPTLFDAMVSNRVGAGLLKRGIKIRVGTPEAELFNAKVADWVNKEKPELAGLLMPPEGPGGSPVGGGAPGYKPYWRPPVINMGQREPPAGFGQTAAERVAKQAAAQAKQSVREWVDSADSPSQRAVRLAIVRANGGVIPSGAFNPPAPPVDLRHYADKAPQDTLARTVQNSPELSAYLDRIGARGNKLPAVASEASQSAAAMQARAAVPDVSIQSPRQAELLRKQLSAQQGGEPGGQSFRYSPSEELSRLDSLLQRARETGPRAGGGQAQGGSAGDPFADIAAAEQASSRAAAAQAAAAQSEALLNRLITRAQRSNFDPSLISREQAAAAAQESRAIRTGIQEQFIRDSKGRHIKATPENAPSQDSFAALKNLVDPNGARTQVHPAVVRTAEAVLKKFPKPKPNVEGGLPLQDSAQGKVGVDVRATRGDAPKPAQGDMADLAREYKATQAKETGGAEFRSVADIGSVLHEEVFGRSAGKNRQALDGNGKIYLPKSEYDAVPASLKRYFTPDQGEAKHGVNIDSLEEALKRNHIIGPEAGIDEIFSAFDAYDKLPK